MSKAVGAPLDRVDGPAKVTGRAVYAADTRVADLAHGVLVQSTIAKGRITSIDTRAAEAAPGVLAVITYRNAPRLTKPDIPFGPGQSYLPVQDDVIHHSGQHIAVVVAEILEQARYAATLVEVEYRSEQSITRLADGLKDAYVPPGGLGAFTRGDPTAALAAAAVRVETAFATPVYHHNPMEPSATIAVWQGDELTLYESTQGISLTRSVVAATLGIAIEKVRVVTPFLGGGFGCKGFSWPHTVLTALAARAVGRPVKLVLTRAQSYTSHGHRGEISQSIKLGAARDGRLTAIEHTSTSQTSPFDNGRSNGIEATGSLYACRNVGVTERLVRLNLGTPTPLRAPGGPGMHALETAMDELAYATGIDPIELRLTNHADVDPENGEPWAEGAKFLKDCYAIGADRFDWRRRDPRPRSMRDGRTLVGLGMATACHPFYAGPSEAAVVLSVDGRALMQSGTQDIGTGTYTVMTQVAADALGMQPGSVRFELGDTALPPAGLSAGSATVTSVTGAVHRAGTAARDEVVRIAIDDPRSPLYGATPERISVSDGRLFRTDEPRKGETYEQVLTRHGQPVRARSGNGADGFGMGLSYGAIFTEVRIDPDLGRIGVARIVGAYDAGRILNHKTARSQAIGGIIWGIGMALMEHTLIDRNLGRIVTSSLSTYLVPVEADVPDIDVQFVDKAGTTGTALGARGVGEVTATGVSAAIGNAVYHATGRRIRDLPITPDTLL